MANILELPTGSTLGENDFFPGVQGGSDKKFTFQNIPEATLDSKGLMSYFDKRKLSSEAMAYGFGSGLLIRTNIHSSSSVMFIVEFTVNSYSDNPPQRTIIQGYNFNTDNCILHACGAVICGNPITVKCFIHNGYLCFWTKETKAYQTFIVNLSTNEKSTYITGVEDAQMPTNVTRLVEVIPVSSSAKSMSANQPIGFASKDNPILPPPSNSVPNDQLSARSAQELSNSSTPVKPSVDLDRLVRIVDHLCTKYPDDVTLQQILASEVQQS